MGKWFDLPFGWFGPYDDNETELGSNISDCAKYRGGVRADKLGPTDHNLVAFTGNVIRSDGRHNEQGGYRVGLRPDRGGGCLRGFVCDGDGKETEVFYADGYNLLFRAGPFALVFQGSDGNLVSYDTRVANGVGDPAAAVGTLLRLR